MTEETILELPEENVADQQNESSEVEFDTEGLSQGEIEMAKEHGLIKEDESGEHKEQSETKTEDNTEEEEVDKDPESFEKIDELHEKDEKKFHETYTPNQKALYFKNKAEKRKRQEAQKELEEVRCKYELDGVKSMVATKKLEQIKNALSSPDLTVEQLQAIIDSSTEFKSEPKKLTKEEYEAEKELESVSAKKEQAELNERILLAEEIGRSKDSDFDNLVKYAEEVFKAKPYKHKQFRNMLLDNSYDEDEIADYVIETAKLSNKYGQGTPEKTEEVNRAIKNSKKKVSSASLSASGKSKVPESELTCEQAARLSTDQWSKLKDTTKKRIMMGIDP